MKIAIDISQTAYKGTGVARYMVSLVHSLIKHSDHEYTFVFHSLRGKPPKNVTQVINDPHTLHRTYIPPTLASWLWNDMHIVPIEYIVGKTDVFISSDWTQPPVKNARSLTIVHDMIPYLFPETSTTDTSFSLKNLTITPNIVNTHKKRLKHVSREVDHIVADSESTKKDLQRILDIQDERITVVYPAVYTPRTVKPHTHDRPYILSVGKLEPRKNIDSLIQAFAQSKLYKELDLIIVGERGWGDIPSASSSDIVEAVSFTGFVSDKKLFSLYKGAEMFVFPSLYEGFGYPIIEAMAMETPVAASNTSSTGELVKNYGLTFDPESVTSISKTMKKLHKNTALKKRLTQSAKKYADEFTEKRFAKHMLQVIEAQA